MIKNEDDPAKPDPEKASDAALETELEKPPANLSTNSPWKAFILTGLIASLLGAVGGGFGIYAGLKTQKPSAAHAPKVDLSPIEVKLKQLAARLDAAEANVKKAANRPVAKTKVVDLSGLEKRLDKLESAPAPNIDPTALTALQSAQKDGFEWPDTSVLEGRLAELETKLDEASEPAVPADLLDLSLIHI